jgi:hypothetical protein
MTGAWPFLALGLLLLVLVIVLLQRAAPSEHDPAEFSEEGETPAALYAESFPQRLVDRLFGSEDWEFMAKQEPARLKRLFLQQRTALALSWVRDARTNATKLIRIHSAVARKNSRLEPLVELRVIADYLVFQILCQLIASVIWLRGPVAMGRLVGYADDLSERLYEVISRAFPAELAYGHSNRQPAPPGAGRARGR